MNHAALIAKNAARWKAAKITRGTELNAVAKRLVAAKPRYLTVSVRTGVPWFVIAVIHQRESSQRWDRSLAQGDPWNQKSTHVPKGRGPFDSWEAAAIDALVSCHPHAGRWKDWSAGGTMTILELYNGLGYANKGIPSPYVWSGTDQYQRGKYIADGHFDPGHVDKQLGCAGLILAMIQLDPSIRLGGMSMPPPPDVPLPLPKPTVKNVGIGAAIAAAFAAAVVFFRDHPIEVLLGAGVIGGGVYALLRYLKKDK